MIQKILSAILLSFFVLFSSCSKKTEAPERLKVEELVKNLGPVKEVKKEIGNDFAAIQSMTAEQTKKMFTEVAKGQDMTNPTITPEQVSDLIIGSVAGLDGVNRDALNTLGQALTDFFQTTLEQAPLQEKGDEEAGQ